MATTKKIKGEKVWKEVTFDLTQKRVAELGRENADYDQQITELEAERKLKSDEYKAKIDALAAKRQENSALIREEHETKNVECIMVKNFEENAVEYYFNDEKVDSRPMTEEERQIEMKLKTPKTTTETKGTAKTTVLKRRNGKTTPVTTQTV